MLFAVERRSMLESSLPSKYLGNCPHPCFVEAATANLLSGETRQ
jgi:hypothetical protein